MAIDKFAWLWDTVIPKLEPTEAEGLVWGAVLAGPGRLWRDGGVMMENPVSTEARIIATSGFEAEMEGLVADLIPLTINMAAARVIGTTGVEFLRLFEKEVQSYRRGGFCHGAREDHAREAWSLISWSWSIESLYCVARLATAIAETEMPEFSRRGFENFADWCDSAAKLREGKAWHEDALPRVKVTNARLSVIASEARLNGAISTELRGGYYVVTLGAGEVVKRVRVPAGWQTRTEVERFLEDAQKDGADLQVLFRELVQRVETCETVSLFTTGRLPHVVRGSVLEERERYRKSYLEGL